MKLSLFDYHLPKKLIAQKPTKPRDHSRLMVIDRITKKVSHHHFFDLPKFLNRGDVLVLNNTKVFPARLWAAKKETGGKVEVLLLKNLKGKTWEVLLGGKIRKKGMILQFGEGLESKVIKKNKEGIWQLHFNKNKREILKIVEKIGHAPTPPYIKTIGKKEKVKKDYQTIFAEKIGSVAAPTAGLHFTKPLLSKLRKKGVQIEYITLHVGLGTFMPVKVADIKKNQMHPEWVEVKKATLRRIKQAKREGKRIVAVGTTSVRTLETTCNKPSHQGYRGWINLYIYPGYRWQIVDSLITNFHLPKSTLLILVSALAGRRFTLSCYQKAVAKKYHFYSFGDAMLIK